MAKIEMEMEVKVNSEKMVDAFADLTKSLIGFVSAFNTVVDASKELGKAVKKLEKSKMILEIISKQKPKIKWWQFWKRFKNNQR